MEQETRVRMNFKQTSKGLCQMDVTTETPSVPESATLMSDAIDSLKRILASKGLKIAHE